MTYKNKCSGWYNGVNYDRTIYETILDEDGDNLDDCVEEMLVDSFALQIWNDQTDGCPGPVNPQVRLCHARVQSMIDGWGGGGGSSFFTPRVLISCAVLYDSDCGSGGHTADVEPYQLSLSTARATGNILVSTGGGRSNRNLLAWSLTVAQTEAHQGTIAEVVNTCYYPTCRSAYAARNKHGNYQTLTSCNNLIDTCGTMAWRSRFRNEDVGEPAAPRIGDLGIFHPQWTGYTPWDGRTFLGGGAGSIRNKMELTAAHQADVTYETCSSWCSLEKACCSQAGHSLSLCTSAWQTCKEECYYNRCVGTYCY